ncbi:Rad2 nuclease [Scheffersomyces spartinae]|uniref:Rad2 nuclease n=1 Tax=Scheffersomyces spartinae TaxID=45513 RepID=A0A9P7VED7_9ASCO|nr:Rad2 nuclease [Scheffersomyces spartinae]KAG7196137.1 Rad2 nuclease [Scheffersomyces spartinae]
MGVTGLLPLLKDIQEPCTLERYRGKTLAIDGFGWMHRALISCSQDLCQNRPTRRYITAVTNKLQMLRHFGIEPYLVFDGAPLPTKADTNSERRQRREEARSKADAYVALGNPKLAWKEFMKAASVTFEMVKSVMVELDALGIKYVVAPYEADPQMVYMEKIGLVDGILSEDSDLLVFGCRVLITKLKDNGTCVEINRDNFSKVKATPFLRTISQEHLRFVAMIAGCDYTKGLVNVGMKKAINFISKYNQLDKTLLALQTEGNIRIPPEFSDELAKADLAFKYQKVFDPTIQELTTLTEYPEILPASLDILETCCGRTIDSETIAEVANGRLHPITHDLLVSREQSLSLLKSNSVILTKSFQLTTAASATRSVSMTSKPSPRTIDTFFKKDPKRIKIQSSTASSSFSLSTSSSMSISSSISATSSTLTTTTSADSLDTYASPTKRKLNRFNAASPVIGERSVFFSSHDISSSPVKQPVPQQQPKQPHIQFSDNVLDDLTDDECEDVKPSAISSMSLSASKPTVPSSDDLEIEESPVKTTQAQVMQWREKFQFEQPKSINKARPALTLKDVNTMRPSKVKLQAEKAPVTAKIPVVSLDIKTSSTVKLNLFAYHP